MVVMGVNLIRNLCTLLLCYSLSATRYIGPTVLKKFKKYFMITSNTFVLGGVRVPAFINSKLLINAGVTSMDLMHVTDWLPTIVNLAGGSIFIFCQVSNW